MFEWYEIRICFCVFEFIFIGIFFLFLKCVFGILFEWVYLYIRLGGWLFNYVRLRGNIKVYEVFIRDMFFVDEVVVIL